MSFVIFAKFLSIKSDLKAGKDVATKQVL